MKKLIYLAALVLIFGCQKNDDNNPTSPSTNSTSKAQIEKTVQGGTWIITDYNDDGTDKTQHFSSYRFTFQDDGSLLATESTNSYFGSWNLTDSKSNDDSQDDLHFNILFTESNVLLELNDDWDVLSHNASMIVLNDVSGGNGGIDRLVFEKK